MPDDPVTAFTAAARARLTAASTYDDWHAVGGDLRKALAALDAARKLHIEYDPDFNDALGAWIEADKAVDKARRALERAERVAQQREAELRAVYDRLTRE